MPSVLDGGSIFYLSVNVADICMIWTSPYASHPPLNLLADWVGREEAIEQGGDGVGPARLMCIVCYRYRIVLLWARPTRV